MELKPLKVSELNQYIKRLIISDPILYNISVEGEISNFKHHHNGHMYFTIKDEKSKLKCIMFSEDCDNLNWIPANGVNVFVNGYVSIYDKEGTYQLYAKKMRKKGIGELHEALQELKIKLEKEGLFKQEVKKTLPFMPKKIGVITSSTGAVVRDIITTVKRRMNSTDIFIYEAMVQGENAHLGICKGIKYFNKNKSVDVVIVARGGGSIEELWSFNKEEIAREIYKSKIPVISAIGHETDFTIADFVSDKRASTPSVAGEMVVPSQDDMEFKINSLFNKLIKSYKGYIDIKRINNEHLKSIIDLNSPLYYVNKNKNKIHILWSELKSHTLDKINENKNNIDKLRCDLNILSPLSTLNRGFSIPTNKNGDIIKSTKDVDLDESIKIILRDGNLEVKVIDIESKVNEDE